MNVADSGTVRISHLYIMRILVTVAGLAATNQIFSAVTSMSSDFGSNPVDGIMGLGWPQISSLRAVSRSFLNGGIVNVEKLF